MEKQMTFSDGKPECASKTRQELHRYANCPAAFERTIPIRRNPGQFRDLFPPKAGYPAVSVLRKVNVERLQSRSALEQKHSEFFLSLPFVFHRHGRIAYQRLVII